MRGLFLVLLVLAIAFVGGRHSDTPTLAVSGGALFAGSDYEEFINPGLPDKMAVMTTSGGSIIGNVIVNVEVYLNGLAPTGAGTLFSGDALSNAHNVLNFDGSLVSTIPGPLPSHGANEDLAFDGTHVWRAHWPEGPLFQYDPDDGSVVNSYAQTDVVGATFVGSTLWISKWNGLQVGTFDPGTNTFTSKFSTPSKPGGLAYDAGNDILWVGLQGGTVEAWDLSGSPTKIAGSEFQPFGAIGDAEVDGLAFVPSGEPPTPTPTPTPCPLCTPTPTPIAVGGIVELRAGGSDDVRSADGSGSGLSAWTYAAIAGGAAAVLAFVAGGWYARRRRAR